MVFYFALKEFYNKYCVKCYEKFVKLKNNLLLLNINK